MCVIVGCVLLVINKWTTKLNRQNASSILTPTFTLNLLRPRSLRPSVPPLNFILKIRCSSRVMTILSPRRMNIPMYTACHCKQIFGLVLTQYQHLILRSITIFELYNTPRIYMSFVSFHLALSHSSCFTIIQ